MPRCGATPARGREHSWEPAPAAAPVGALGSSHKASPRAGAAPSRDYRISPSSAKPRRCPVLTERTTVLRAVGCPPGPARDLPKSQAPTQKAHGHTEDPPGTLHLLNLHPTRDGHMLSNSVPFGRVDDGDYYPP